MRKIQELSALLRSSVCMIYLYDYIYKTGIFGLIKRENVLLSCRKLNVLSYGLKVSKNQDYKNSTCPSEVGQKNEKLLVEIARLLQIETTYVMDNENII